jgi:hypothetical protein
VAAAARPINGIDGPPLFTLATRMAEEAALSSARLSGGGPPFPH